VPSSKRPGKRHLYIEIPEALGQALEALADKNRRTITAEVTIALENHLQVTPDPAPARPKRRKKGE
jgi:hypothetical protein